MLGCCFSAAAGLAFALALFLRVNPLSRDFAAASREDRQEEGVDWFGLLIIKNALSDPANTNLYGVAGPQTMNLMFSNTCLSFFEPLQLGSG